ncbi:hypothetical protein CTEN210_14238 [Chaetoceros tenuissimus]|uniref:Protochlorophyllide reductase n=1 Tax=Chaetoceros tenuissimus TaxID=426638 RepID=A0AAD3D4I9_9STRA|nr:hypothetical protein CTEN210_14238 [Chaetoceros tenuissimus]
MRSIFKVVIYVIFPLILSCFYRYVTYVQSIDPFASFDRAPFNITDISRLIHSNEAKTQVVLITGASSGLGKSSVKFLAQGFAQGLNDESTSELNIIMACRNMKKCENVRKEILSEVTPFAQDNMHRFMNTLKLLPMKLDLEKSTSIKMFVEELETSLETMGDTKVNVLMNNAGVMGISHQIVEETNTEIQMHVNHLGHFRLTSYLIKKQLFHSKHARVVNVSSLAAILPQFLQLEDINFEHGYLAKIKEYLPTLASIIYYGASKRANLYFTHSLHEKYSIQGIESVAAHPGYSRTSIMFTGWSWAPQFIKEVMAQNTIASMHSDDGALMQLRAALDLDTVKSGDYIVPMWFTAGRAVNVGKVFGKDSMYIHHFVKSLDWEWKRAEDLWSWSKIKIVQ